MLSNQQIYLDTKSIPMSDQSSIQVSACAKDALRVTEPTRQKQAMARQRKRARYACDRCKVSWPEHLRGLKSRRMGRSKMLTIVSQTKKSRCDGWQPCSSCTLAAAECTFEQHLAKERTNRKRSVYEIALHMVLEACKNENRLPTRLTAYETSDMTNEDILKALGLPTTSPGAWRSLKRTRKSRRWQSFPAHLPEVHHVPRHPTISPNEGNSMMTPEESTTSKCSTISSPPDLVNMCPAGFGTAEPVFEPSVWRDSSRSSQFNYSSWAINKPQTYPEACSQILAGSELHASPQYPWLHQHHIPEVTFVPAEPDNRLQLHTVNQAAINVDPYYPPRPDHYWSSLSCHYQQCHQANLHHYHHHHQAQAR